MHLGEARSPDDMRRGDAVDTGVEAAEPVARIDQRLIFELDTAIAKPDDSDLADAADPGTGGFDVDDDEVGRVRDLRGGHDGTGAGGTMRRRIQPRRRAVQAARSR
jgi:hypothetical protein